MNRALMVEKVAQHVAHESASRDAFADSPYTFAELQTRNAQGWTMEESRPLNAVIRAEGVVLSPVELRRAWLMARELAAVL